MKKNILKSTGLIIGSLSVFPFLAYADEVTETIQNVVSWLTMVGGGLAILAIVIAGIFMVVSAENPDNVDRAKKIILWASIGLIIILLANALTSIVESLVA